MADKELDVEVFHLETREPLVFSKVAIEDSGPIRAALKAELKLAKSTVSVLVSQSSRSMYYFDSLRCLRSPLMLSQVRVPDGQPT